MTKRTHHPKNKFERLEIAKTKGNKKRRPKDQKETQDADRNHRT